MAKFTLTIETDDAYELANLTAALADEAGEAAPANLMEDAARVMNPKPKTTRGRKASASAVEQTGVVESPAKEPTQVSPSTTASPFDLNVKQGEGAVAEIKNPAATTITMADLKAKLNDLIAATDTDKALGVLKSVGIERISACPEDKFAELMAKMTAAIG